MVIQHGSLGRRKGTGSTGFGLATVEADTGEGPVSLGVFLDSISVGPAEETVKQSTFDVAGLVEVNAAGVMTLTVDGTGLANPVDAFAIDFVELRLTGVFCPASLDSDGDGVVDADDNCVTIANAGQQDTNGDGFGNACDADLDNSGVTNFQDLVQFSNAFLSSPGSPAWNPDADLNSDDLVNFLDLITLSNFFLQPPGTSCAIFQ